MEQPHKKIIWVEDDKLLGSLLSQKLTAAGFDLVCVQSGQDAFAALENIPKALPDLIMVDLILPDMDGFDILDKLGKDPRYAQIPRMVLSNLDSLQDQKRAMLLGAKKFLVKALTSLDQIVNEVKTVF